MSKFNQETKIRNIARNIFIVFTVAVLAAFTNNLEEVWSYDEERAHVGRIYNYERSNTDGTKTERVSVYHKSSKLLEVYKENGLCQNAALVSADMNWTTMSASRITGGALLPNAQRQEFAFMTLDPIGKKLDMVVQLPDMEIKDFAPIAVAPWHLYDFDFASLTVATPHLKFAENGFTFGMSLLWADPSIDDPLTWMGNIEAVYEAREFHLEIDTLKFNLSGTALAGSAPDGSIPTSQMGSLWLDKKDGHIVDVILPAPNHPGYSDFRLKLLSVSDGGEKEWFEKLSNHFKGC